MTNIDPKANLAVSWTPGMRHPSIKHIYAAAVESSWYPDPGYNWLQPTDNTKLDVVWTPGMRHPQFPHVLAHKDEGQWIPEPGFQFINPKADLATVASPAKSP
jgi:hypothetical protein